LKLGARREITIVSGVFDISHIGNAESGYWNIALSAVRDGPDTMLHLKSPIAILLLAATLAFSVRQAAASDPVNGRQLALRWCAACHIVESGQRQASEAAPPFSEIAKKPNFDVGQLVLFLLNPHPVMPNMGLSRLEASDLAAYIAQVGR
jgi:mono/diheme cytochrome c family protein